MKLLELLDEIYNPADSKEAQYEVVVEQDADTQLDIRGVRYDHNDKQVVIELA